MSSDALTAAHTPARTSEVLRPVVPLLGGVLLLMMATGLQSSLIVLRATAEGFGPVVTGAIASAYFAGFLLGARVSAVWIQRVGHVRGFAAFASIASIMVLVHVLAVNVPTWMVARLLTGVCLSGLLVIIESWLNRSVTNQTRGRVLSIYMVVNMGGYTLGQFVLIVFPVESFELFAVVSVLLSVALLPLILSRRSRPDVVTVRPMAIRELLRRTPGGATASAMAGMTWGAIAGWSAVIAAAMGQQGIGVTLFVSAFLVGHLIMEPTVGVVSDRVDRRIVLMGTATAGTVAALTAATIGPRPVILIPLGLVIGGMTLPMYSLSIALTGDRLHTDEMVSAAGAMVRLNGVGAAVGPLLASAVTQRSIAGFYLVIAGGTAVAAAVGTVSLIRSGYRPPRVPYQRLVSRATSTLTTATLRTSGRYRRRRRGDQEMPTNTPPSRSRIS